MHYLVTVIVENTSEGRTITLTEEVEADSATEAAQKAAELV